MSRQFSSKGTRLDFKYSQRIETIEPIFSLVEYFLIGRTKNGGKCLEFKTSFTSFTRVHFRKKKETEDYFTFCSNTTKSFFLILLNQGHTRPTNVTLKRNCKCKRKRKRHIDRTTRMTSSDCERPPTTDPSICPRWANHIICPAVSTRRNTLLASCTTL